MHSIGINAIIISNVGLTAATLSEGMTTTSSSECMTTTASSGTNVHGYTIRINLIISCTDSTIVFIYSTISKIKSVALDNNGYEYYHIN